MGDGLPRERLKSVANLSPRAKPQRAPARASVAPFTYDRDDYPPPTSETWLELLRKGEPGVDGEGDWAEGFVQLCVKSPPSRTAEERDWNSELQEALQRRAPLDPPDTQDATADARKAAVDVLVDEFVAHVEEMVETAVRSVHAGVDADVEVQGLSRGANNLPRGRVEHGNVVIYFSSEPRLPSRVHRNCLSVLSAQVPNLSAPMAVRFAFAGHRVLAIAKIPLSSGRGLKAMGSPLFGGLMSSLGSALGVGSLDDTGIDIWQGADGRFYLVPGLGLMPPLAPGGPLVSLKLGRRAVGSTLSPGVDSELAVEEVLGWLNDGVCGSAKELIGIMRENGLGAWALPRVLTAPELEGDGGKAIRGICLVEMVSRTLRQIITTEVSGLADCDIEEEMRTRTNRIFNTALIEPQGYETIVGPAVAQKYGLSVGDVSWVKHTDPTARQGLLGRTCELLGVGTKQQQVSVLQATDSPFDLMLETQIERAVREQTPGLVEEVKRGLSTDQLGWELYCVTQMAELAKAGEAEPSEVDACFTEVIAKLEKAATLFPFSEEKLVLSQALEAKGRWEVYQGRTGEAADTLRKAAESIQKIVDGVPGEIEAARLNLASAEAALAPRDYSTFEPDIRQTLEGVVEMFQRNISSGVLDLEQCFASYAPALNLLIGALRKTTHLNEAEPHAHRLVEMAKKSKGAHSEETAEVQTELGGVCMELEKVSDASEAYEGALDAYRQLYGPHSSNTANATFNLAFLYFNRARVANKGAPEKLLRPLVHMRPEARECFAKAKELLKEVVELPREVLRQIEDEEGEAPGTAGDRILADALSNLASTCLQSSDWDAAEANYQRYYDLVLERHDDTHQDAVSAQKSIQLVQTKRRQWGQLYLQVMGRGVMERRALGVTRVFCFGAVALAGVVGAHAVSDPELEKERQEKGKEEVKEEVKEDVKEEVKEEVKER
eukprot:Hpha_TRINITY_DN9610_c0_g1::TRINITY_DN9610_c0_g1_i1::g.184342::m.184342